MFVISLCVEGEMYDCTLDQVGVVAAVCLFHVPIKLPSKECLRCCACPIDKPPSPDVAPLAPA
jgi:hypothetical protein